MNDTRDLHTQEIVRLGNGRFQAFCLGCSEQAGTYVYPCQVNAGDWQEGIPEFLIDAERFDELARASLGLSKYMLDVMQIIADARLISPSDSMTVYVKDLEIALGLAEGERPTKNKMGGTDDNGTGGDVREGATDGSGTAGETSQG